MSWKSALSHCISAKRIALLEIMGSEKLIQCGVFERKVNLLPSYEIASEGGLEIVSVSALRPKASDY